MAAIGATTAERKPMRGLTNPIFHEEDQARQHLEALRRPNVPVCPHWGNRIKIMSGQRKTG
jgi:uroporphyrinogen-III synthase